MIFEVFGGLANGTQRRNSKQDLEWVHKGAVELVCGASVHDVVCWGWVLHVGRYPAAATAAAAAFSCTVCLVAVASYSYRYLDNDDSTSSVTCST